MLLRDGADRRAQVLPAAQVVAPDADRRTVDGVLDGHLRLERAGQRSCDRVDLAELLDEVLHGAVDEDGLGLCERRRGRRAHAVTAWG